MDMSMLEITARANFLVFNYIKKTLNQKELADKLKTVLQEKGQKDFIIFKGLEDLTQVLQKYYSAQTSSIGERNNGPANAKDPEKIVLEKADAGGKQERKKKKKQREQQPEVTVASENCDKQPEHQPEEQPQQETGGDQTERKRKKNKRQLESAEGGEQPEGTANGHETAAAAATENSLAQEETEAKAPKKKRKKQRSSPDESVEANNSQEAHGLCERQSEVATSLIAEAADSTLEEGGTSSGKKARQQKLHNQPYRRVREEEVDNKHFKDNSFDAKPGATNGWGYKANEDLRPTQGRSFRHEKTKKKRGSYKGGAIDTGVSSFKFESDSE